MSMLIAALALANNSLAPALSMDEPKVMEFKIPDSLATFKMVRVPDGKIKVGNEEVTITNLWVGQTEVTWDVYDIWAYRMDIDPAEVAKGAQATSRPSRPYGAPDYGFGHTGYAAMSVTSNSANLFCQWLSSKLSQPFRLATENEWRYVAENAASVKPKWTDVAWYWENADDSTHPVGFLKPSPWGIYDLFGNVGEWVLGDKNTYYVMGGTYRDKEKEIGPNAKKSYTIRWQDRDPQKPKSKWWLSDGPHIGLRVVMTLAE